MPDGGIRLFVNKDNQIKQDNLICIVIRGEGEGNTEKNVRNLVSSGEGEPHEPNGVVQGSSWLRYLERVHLVSETPGKSLAARIRQVSETPG